MRWWSWLAGLSVAFIVSLFGGPAGAVVTPGQVNLTTANESVSQSLAPGGTLVFSVKLLNFGLDQRADVQATYEVLNEAGTVVYRQGETVAVETTASFVKHMQLPTTLRAGSYALRTGIVYAGQTTLAQSQFSFRVVDMIFGIPKDSFIAAVAITLVFVAILIGVLVWLMRRWARHERTYVLGYGHVAEDERLYFQLIGESIAQMRILAGDEVLEVAHGIPGLKIHPKTGEVLGVSGNANTILTTLVLRYETMLGHTLQDAARMQHNASNKSKEIS